MAYLGQPFPHHALGTGKPLRHYAMGQMTWSEAFSQATDVELAALNSVIQGGKDLVSNAFGYNAPGKDLTQDQLNAIKAQTNAQILQAAAGNAALAAAAQAQASREIDAAANAPGGSSITNFLANNWPWLLLAGAAGFYIVRDL